VASALRQHHNGLQTEIIVIRTAGDRNRHDPLPKIGGKGLFVKDIEEALLREEIHVAVHSMKDMPTDLPHRLHISAVPYRAEVRDAFVGKDGRRLSQIDEPRRIGTGSLRRRAQLRAFSDVLRVCDLRGNVDTRLRKLRQGDVEGVVLAAAGLQRLGLASEITELLPVDVMLPAAGQGALALETVAGHWADGLLAPLNHPPTATAVAAERTVLQHLGGGCSVPIAVLGEHRDGQLHVQALVNSPDGSCALRRAISGSPEQAVPLGQRLAAQLLADGASDILEAL
jgi:hydroxymethylbilane synthase